MNDNKELLSIDDADKIVMAKTAGFCFGVKRAVDKVYEQIDKTDCLYTYGPIIHNNEVVNDLKNKGVEVISNEGDLDKISNGTIIIRSHGVSKKVIDLLEEKNIDYIDMTCPFVKRIHNVVFKESIDKEIIIIGNAGHPEVEGIQGWVLNESTVIGSVDEAKSFIPQTSKDFCVVSQTTFNYKKFQEIVDVLTKNRYNVSVVNTICDATQKRQEEAANIAARVDAMIVIGDTQSSNSKKLFEICKNKCENTYFVQTLQELQLNPNNNVRTIGITAGASTPNNIIEEVQNYVRVNF